VIRIDTHDWSDVAAALDAHGFAPVPGLLTAAECAGIADLYETEGPFRSHVRMARHGFGQGEYKYFAAPLPPLVAALRTALYPRLVPVARRWAARLGCGRGYPEAHADYLARCHAAGQTRPTPLLLRYGPGDYNCLHQDLYGAEVFPLQVVITLDRPGIDYRGGELMLVEQRPRMQSIGHVLTPGQGDAVVFAVNDRPRQGRRGDHRVRMQHGVSMVTAGRRRALGIIFHDAA
jgi:hypothetical protein